MNHLDLGALHLEVRNAKSTFAQQFCKTSRLDLHQFVHVISQVMLKRLWFSCQRGKIW